MSVTSVGGYHQPSCCGRSPPTSTLAPLSTASLTSSSTSVRPCSVASGPTSVPSSIGSPTTSADISLANSSTNSSYTSVCTTKRFAAMHDCPLFWQREVVATL